VTAVVVALALVLTSAVAATAASEGVVTAVQSQDGGQTAVDAPPSRSDEESARSRARTLGTPVEVMSARTESVQTFANPDGSFTTELADGPVRVKQSDGSWKNLDLDLVATDGGVTQKASPTPVTFSDGGPGPLATATVQGRDLEMSWPGGSLPKPALEANTATYALSDTEDLVLTATRTGFEQSLVLKERPSQAPVVSLPLSMNGLDLSESPRGGYVFTATEASGSGQDKVAAGDAVAAVAAPVMYSAAVDKTGSPTQVQELESTLGEGPDGAGHQLTLTPGHDGMQFLNDPATVYPVTIDPVVASLDEFGDTWIQNGSSTAQFASPYLATGLQTAATRSLVRFDVSPILNQHVTSASLRLWQNVSNTCASKATYAYPIAETYTNQTVTWSNQPSINTSTDYRGSANFNWGYDASCNRAFGTIDVTNMATAWAWGQIPSHGIELQAGSESDASFAKSFCSFDSPATGTCASLDRVPTLSVTYNSYPWPPQDMTATSQVEGTDGTTYVTQTQPEIQATIGNTDDTLVTPQAEVSYDPAYPGDGTDVLWTGSGDPVAPLTTATVKVGVALTEGRHYRYRIRGAAASGTNGVDWGPWSDYTFFRVHTGVPAAPSISCPSYPADVISAPAGAPATCTLSTTTADGAGYLWSLDDPTPGTLVDDGSNNGSAQTFTMHPAQGQHILYVRTRNVALSLSSITTYSFGIEDTDPGDLAPDPTTDPADTETELWQAPADADATVFLSASSTADDLEAAGWRLVPDTEAAPVPLTGDPARDSTTTTAGPMYGVDAANLLTDDSDNENESTVDEDDPDGSLDQVATPADAAAADDALDAQAQAEEEDTAASDTFDPADAALMPADDPQSWDQSGAGSDGVSAAATSSAGDLSPQNITQADCTSKAAYSSKGNVINHFNYCSTSRIAYIIKYNRNEIGRAVVDIRNRGWASKNKRQVDFVLDVTHVQTSEALTKTNTHLSMSEHCLSSGCNDAAANKTKGGDLSWWGDHSGGASFSFDNTKADSNGDKTHYFAYGDFYPHFKFSSTEGRSRSGNGTENGFRCDSDIAFAKKGPNDGCIFNRVLPVIVFSKSNSTYGAEARHIFTALEHPERTYPKVHDKEVPDLLNRLYGASKKEKNHTAAVKVCRAVWGKGYTRSKTRQCDEYPFQSTTQGAASSRNFSVRPIFWKQNRDGGTHLGVFYGHDRIADGDRFRVRIVS
jgi:hypothetical protein